MRSIFISGENEVYNEIESWSQLKKVIFGWWLTPITLGTQESRDQEDQEDHSSKLAPGK
jgi:hypothetical protein